MTILGGVIQSSRFAGLKETWARLGRIDLTSKPLLLSLLGAHVFSVFGFELGRVGEQPLLTLAIALMAEVLFWGAYLTLYALQVWLFRSNNSVFLKVFIIVASNTVRTFTIDYALFQFGLMDEIRIADRFLGDATIILMLLMGIAYIQVVVVELSAQESALREVKARLSASASESKQSAEVADQELRAKANQILGAQLAAISKYLRSTKNPEASKLTAEIQALIVDKVRPLSADLWGQMQRIELDTQVSDEPKKSRWPKRVFAHLDFRPNLVIGLAGLNIFITAPGLANWSLAFALLPWLLLYPILGMLLTAIYPKRLATGTLMGSVIVSVLSTLAWLPGIVFLLLQSNRYPGLGVLSFTSSTLLMFTAVAVAIWSAFKRERLAYLEEIDELNKERSRQLALVDQAVWVARRNWSYLVHGTVQGALTVATSRVQLASAFTPELAKQVLADVERARAALNQNAGFSQSWTEVWPQIEQTWDGVCQVTHSITPEAEALLGSSSATSTCVAEIAKELVSNAFRHGKATQVDISISAATEQDLRITSTNNGSSVQKGRVEGIGSEMFDELTTQWSCKNTPKGPRFTALVPVGTNP